MYTNIIIILLDLAISNNLIDIKIIIIQIIDRKYLT